MKRVASIAAATTLTWMLACAEPSGPAPVYSVSQIVIDPGAVTNDTVDATSTLNVRVMRNDGVGVSNSDVGFDVPAGFSHSNVTIRAVGDTAYRAHVVVKTDASGNARIETLQGQVAKSSVLNVTVDGSSLTKTLTLTTAAGRLARLVTSPSDTLVKIGATVQITATPADRYGNPRTDVVDFITAHGPGSVDMKGFFVATGSGVASVIVSARSSDNIVLKDSAAVGIVPPSSVLYEFAGNIYSSELRAQGSRNSGVVGIQPDLKPGTSEFVFRNGQVLKVGSFTGSSSQIQAAPITAAEDPAYSADGTWIYFAGADATFVQTGWHIWRTRSDAWLPEMVSTIGATSPAPSPDGKNVAFISGTSLMIMDLQSGAVRTVMGAGVTVPRQAIGFAQTGTFTVTGATAPQWSPDNKYIATVNSGSLLIIEVATGQTFAVGSRQWRPEKVAWSPDGKWIIGSTMARSNETGAVVSTETLHEYDAGLEGTSFSWK